MPFVALLLQVPALRLFGDGGAGEHTEPRRQPLLLAFFLAPLDLKVNVVRVPPFLLKFPASFPEVSFVKSLAVRQFLGEIGIQIAADLFDFDDGILQRFLLCTWELRRVVEQSHEVIYTFVQQKEAFVDSKLTGTAREYKAEA
jgi:hypothetical protein